MDQRWLGKEYADIGHHDVQDTVFPQSITYCDGKLYAATFSKRYLMVIQKNLKLRPLYCRLPRTFSPCASVMTYLLDFCGQLCFVEVSWGGVNDVDIIDIHVSKLELSGNRVKWVRVKSFEDRALFLSNYYAFSCPVNEPEIEGGHIYLFENKRFYSFNVKDRSFSVSLPSQNLSQLKNSPFLAMRDLIRLRHPQAKPEHPINKLGTVDEDNNEARANILCDLPFGILELILKKLNFVDYIKFQSVCHNFLLVAPYIRWSGTLFKFKSPSWSPCLVFPRGTTFNFIDPHSVSIFLANIPERLLGGNVRYSKDGWLLLCSPSFMFFYHLFTKEHIELPQGDGEHNCCLGYGLSSSPTSADSILVGNSYHSIYYFCRRQGEWLEYNFPDFYDFEPNHNGPIYFNGAFYFLGRDGNVAVFRFNDGQASWKILQELQSPCDNCCYNYLLECGGNLLSVFVVGQMVHIYKLNFTAPETWEKVTSLRNYALFVSPSSSFSVIPNSSNMENKVYFRKLYGMNIIYYCLSTNKFYTCGKEEVVADFNNTTEFIFSTWIVPGW